MSMEVYRELMGVGSSEAFDGSVQAVKAGYEAVSQGKTRSFKDFLEELRHKYEIPR